MVKCDKCGETITRFRRVSTGTIEEIFSLDEDNTYDYEGLDETLVDEVEFIICGECGQRVSEEVMIELEENM